jgi:hypothetical protein
MQRFFLRNSQKYTTFALEKKRRQLWPLNLTPTNLFMKIDYYRFKQRAQEFILRLFIESSKDDSTLSLSDSHFYTGAHCGTFSRLHH